MRRSAPSDDQPQSYIALNPTPLQPINSSRTKHIDIKHHLIRELVDKRTNTLRYIPTAKQQADILTRGLPGSSCTS